MANSTNLSQVLEGWFQTSASTERAEAESEPTDVVELGLADPDVVAMQDLRNWSRATRPFPTPDPPLPTEVRLPEIPAGPAAPQALREFHGQAPLPRKLDVHSLVSGEKVAQAARHWGGTKAKDLTGKLPGFADTTGMAETGYGQTNQCANFVSTFARRLGLKGHYLSVPRLREALQQQGWTKVSQEKAIPGDVWMSDSHTELVTRAPSALHGLPEVTGSNNGGHYRQTISSHLQSGGSFYTRPVRRLQK